MKSVQEEVKIRMELPENIRVKQYIKILEERICSMEEMIRDGDYDDAGDMAHRTRDIFVCTNKQYIGWYKLKKMEEENKKMLEKNSEGKQ